MPPHESALRDRFALVCVLMLALLAHINGTVGPFQFDDYASVAVDPSMQQWSAWWERAGQSIRPLLKASFVASHALGEQLDAVLFGHHAVNLLVHLACVVLAWVLARGFVRTCVSASPRDAGEAGLWCAALIGLHPLATEAVTYISGRSVSLSTLCAFVAIVAYMRGVDHVGTRRWAWSISGALAYAAALAVRETAIIVPAVLLLWEWSRRDGAREPFTLARLIECAPRLWPFAAVAALGLVWLATNDRYDALLGLSARIAADRPFSPSLLISLDYFATRVLLLAPLSIDPDLTWESVARGERIVLSIVWLAIAAACWRMRRQRLHWLIGLIWVLVWLAPTALVPARHDVVSERHYYPAIWAIAFIVAIEGMRLARKARWGVRVVLAGLALVLGVATAMRNLDYASEIALWEATARTSPHKPRVLNNLGVAYLDAGRWDDAEAVFRRVLDIDAGYARARDNLDLTLLRRRTGDPNVVLGP